MNERAPIGGGGGGGGPGLAGATRLIEMMRHFGVSEDPVLRDERAKIYTGYQVAELPTSAPPPTSRPAANPGPSCPSASSPSPPT